ncbi:MAG TPA: hypothetical protein VHZ54_12715 [Solirubrobacterales bacterium]|nr:hypothetical protein [Solirubrobacterales bacterium]
MTRVGRYRVACIAALSVLAVAVLSALSGCGSGGDPATASAAGSSAGTASITKAVFIKRGNAICRRALEEQEATVAAAERQLGHGRAVSAVQRVRLLIELAPRFFERKTEELASLPVPPHEEAQVRAIVVGYEDGVREIEARPVTVVRGTPFLKGRKAAGRYGLTECD